MKKHWEGRHFWSDKEVKAKVCQHMHTVRLYFISAGITSVVYSKSIICCGHYTKKVCPLFTYVLNICVGEINTLVSLLDDM
jgi:hypothetical protein